MDVQIDDVSVIKLFDCSVNVLLTESRNRFNQRIYLKTLLSSNLAVPASLIYLYFLQLH